MRSLFRYQLSVLRSAVSTLFPPPSLKPGNMSCDHSGFISLWLPVLLELCSVWGETIERHRINNVLDQALVSSLKNCLKAQKIVNIYINKITFLSVHCLE